MPNDIPKDQVQRKTQKKGGQCLRVFQFDFGDFLDIITVLIAEFYDEIGS